MRHAHALCTRARGTHYLQILTYLVQSVRSPRLDSSEECMSEFVSYGSRREAQTIALA